MLRGCMINVAFYSEISLDCQGRVLPVHAWYESQNLLMMTFLLCEFQRMIPCPLEDILVLKTCTEQVEVDAHMVECICHFDP